MAGAAEGAGVTSGDDGGGGAGGDGDDSGGGGSDGGGSGDVGANAPAVRRRPYRTVRP